MMNVGRIDVVVQYEAVLWEILDERRLWFYEKKMGLWSLELLHVVVKCGDTSIGITFSCDVSHFVPDRVRIGSFAVPLFFSFASAGSLLIVPALTVTKIIGKNGTIWQKRDHFENGSIPCVALAIDLSQLISWGGRIYMSNHAIVSLKAAPSSACLWKSYAPLLQSVTMMAAQLI